MSKERDEDTQMNIDISRLIEISQHEQQQITVNLSMIFPELQSIHAMVAISERHLLIQTADGLFYMMDTANCSIQSLSQHAFLPSKIASTIKPILKHNYLIISTSRQLDFIRVVACVDTGKVDLVHVDQYIVESREFSVITSLTLARFMDTDFDVFQLFLSTDRQQLIQINKGYCEYEERVILDLESSISDKLSGEEYSKALRIVSLCTVQDRLHVLLSDSSVLELCLSTTEDRHSNGEEKLSARAGEDDQQNEKQIHQASLRYCSYLSEGTITGMQCVFTDQLVLQSTDSFIVNRKSYQIDGMGIIQIKLASELNPNVLQVLLKPKGQETTGNANTNINMHLDIPENINDSMWLCMFGTMKGGNNQINLENLQLLEQLDGNIQQVIVMACKSTIEQISKHENNQNHRIFMIDNQKQLKLKTIVSFEMTLQAILGDSQSKSLAGGLFPKNAGNVLRLRIPKKKKLFHSQPDIGLINVSTNKQSNPEQRCQLAAVNQQEESLPQRETILNSFQSLKLERQLQYLLRLQMQEYFHTNMKSLGKQVQIGNLVDSIQQKCDLCLISLSVDQSAQARCSNKKVQKQQKMKQQLGLGLGQFGQKQDGSNIPSSYNKNGLNDVGYEDDNNMVQNNSDDNKIFFPDCKHCFHKICLFSAKAPEVHDCPLCDQYPSVLQLSAPPLTL